MRSSSDQYHGSTHRISYTLGSEPTVVVDDITTTLSDVAVTLNVLANDAPSGGLAVFPASVSQPAHGEVVLNPDDTVTYRQAGLAFEGTGLGLYKANCGSCHSVTGFSGTDSFSYTVTSSSATVTVTVNSFDNYGSSPDLSGYTPSTACSDLPVIGKHSGCLGLGDADIAEIGQFVGEVFRGQTAGQDVMACPAIACIVAGMCTNGAQE